MPAYPNAAQRFSRALAATLEESHCSSRRRDTFSWSGPIDHVPDVVECDKPAVQRRVTDHDGLVERRDARCVHHCSRGGGDRQPAHDDDVGRVEWCGVDVYSSSSAAAGRVIASQMYPLERDVTDIHIVQQRRGGVAHHDTGWPRLQGRSDAYSVQCTRVESGEVRVGDVRARGDPHKLSGPSRASDLGVGDAVSQGSASKDQIVGHGGHRATRGRQGWRAHQDFSATLWMERNLWTTRSAETLARRATIATAAGGNQRKQVRLTRTWTPGRGGRPCRDRGGGGRRRGAVRGAQRWGRGCVRRTAAVRRAWGGFRIRRRRRR